MGLALGGVYRARQDREHRAERAASAHRARLERAVHTASEALDGVADHLQLARERLGRAGTDEERQRELSAVLAAGAHDQAIALFRPSGSEPEVLAHPQASAPVQQGQYAELMRETALQARKLPPGQLVASPPPAAPLDPWYRVFATSLDGPEAERSAVAILVDTAPLFAPLRELTLQPESHLLLLGTEGRPAPLSDPRLVGWYSSPERLRIASRLLELLGRTRTGQRGVARLSGDETRRLGLEPAEAVVAYAPIPMKGLAGWMVVYLESIRSLSGPDGAD